MLGTQRFIIWKSKTQEVDQRSLILLKEGTWLVILTAYIPEKAKPKDLMLPHQEQEIESIKRRPAQVENSLECDPMEALPQVKTNRK